MGLATLGTWLGVQIGNAHQKQAEILREDVLEELLSVMDVQLNTLEAKEYQQGLAALVKEPERFQSNYAEFLEYTEAAREAWAELEDSYEAAESAGIRETDEELDVFNNVQKKYGGALDNYEQQVRTIVESVDLLDNSPESIAANQEIFLALGRNPIINELDDFIHGLEDLVDAVIDERVEAEEALHHASRLRSEILTASILLSMIVAAWIALYTSRTICQPVRSATEFADQVKQTGDFSLQAPVTTNDEIGYLTAALNQLVGRVRELMEDQQRTRAHLMQAEKMSSLGQMVAGVAHEINNPVNFIHGNVTHAENYTQDLLNLIDLYQTHYPDPPEEIQEELEAIELDFLKEDIGGLLKSMRVGTERIREIVLSLRNFSRLDEAALKVVDLHEGIDSTLLILQNRFKAKPDYPEIKVIKTYGKLPPVECYPSQLNQVLMNILSNGLDAIEEWNRDRPPEAVKADPGSIQIRTELADQDWVKISVVNSGREIPSQVREKLFDPFFTTKPIGKGTGLGLSISYQIVTEKHHGKLWCNSIPNQGAEFVIQVPVRQPAGMKVPQPEVPQNLVKA
ncbi:MAG: HAMP domain-containing protein [Oscillatoriales cyanobacterium SM2_3_0]|nr:HAMP domain-containing protein [Oscillatoriales cyanobacterium SM2_3_0]